MIEILDSRRKRPIIVWVIVIVSILSWIWVMFSFLALFTGFIPPKEALEAINKVKFIDILLILLSAGLNITAIVFLFRLNANAVVWWGAYCSFILINFIYNNILRSEYISFYSNNKISDILSIIIHIITFLYILYLKTKKVLVCPKGIN